MAQASGDLFESELSHIENSPRFRNMLKFNSDLEQKKRRDVLVVYHAFSSACDSAICENPLTIGGYVRRVLEMEDKSMIASAVSEARRTWGAK